MGGHLPSRTLPWLLSTLIKADCPSGPNLQADAGDQGTGGVRQCAGLEADHGGARGGPDCGGVWGV